MGECPPIALRPLTLVDQRVVPTRMWLRTALIFAAGAAGAASARAQVDAELGPVSDHWARGAHDEPEARDLEELPSPADSPTAVRESPPSALQELPLPEEPDAASPHAVVPELENAAPVGPVASISAFGNAQVLEMVTAEFSDATIISIIAVNPAEYDLSPRSLVALKSAGVSERVIEAMVAAETAEQRAAQPTPVSAEPPASAPTAQEYAKLTEMIERLAAQQETAEKAQRAPEPPASRADPSPRVWLVGPVDRTAIAPTIAQVALAGGNRRGERFQTLQGLAGQALAFANPAVSGIATTLGSLFRPDEKRTAVWALAATSSTRVLTEPTFEIDYTHIPGVDPDRYVPAMVQLVPTNDNYRLVAAAEMDGANAGKLPDEPIIEETVATESTRLDRGHYRVAPKAPLGPGEYALVLRPTIEPKRSRRKTEASLGELLGGSTTQILYLTWEFSIAPL